MLLNRIEEHVLAHKLTSFRVSLHGGEPLLWGKKNFKWFANEVEQRRARTGCRIGLSLTTNGVLIDSEWADLLKRYEVAVAVSCDGPPAIHDTRRLNFKGKGTHARVEVAIKDLITAGVTPYILAVCDPNSNPNDVAGYFLNTLGLSAFDILIPDATHDDPRVPIDVFYNGLFDFWLKENRETHRAKIRSVENFLIGLVGGRADAESIGFGPVGICTVLTDGTIKPLDVLGIAGPDSLGRSSMNIATNRLDEIPGDPAWSAARRVATTLNATCITCKYRYVCGGGNIAHRYSRKNGYDNTSAHCESFKKIFAHMEARISHLIHDGDAARLPQDWGVDRKLVEPLQRRLSSGSAAQTNDLVAEFGLPLKVVRKIQAQAQSTEPSADRLTRADTPLRSLYELAASLDHTADNEPILLRFVQQAVERAPAPVLNLDHVAATPDALVRRALLIRQRYYFDGIRILCLGDHDLTSIALGIAMPQAAVTVCDIDEQVLAHINATSQEFGSRIATYCTDLRIGLNRELLGKFDLVITDPPYSAPGVELFCARAIEALTDTRPSVLLLCYGESVANPDRACEVQLKIGAMGLAVESMLQNFNAYNGAYAIGCRSDLYALRPTRHSLPVAKAVQVKSHIYTRGCCAIDVDEYSAPDTFRVAIRQRFGSSILHVGVGWQTAVNASTQIASITLQEYFAALNSPHQGDRFQDRSTVAASLMSGYQQRCWQLLVSSKATTLCVISPTSDGCERPLIGDVASAVGRFLESKYRSIASLVDNQTHSCLSILQQQVPSTLDTRRHAVARYICDHWDGIIGNALSEAVLLLPTNGSELAPTENAARLLASVNNLAHKQMSDLTASEAELLFLAIEQFESEWLSPPSSSGPQTSFHQKFQPPSGGGVVNGTSSQA